MSDSLSPATQHLLMTVRPDTVLQARKILKSEAARLKNELNTAMNTPFEGCGDDYVSRDAVKAFPQRINLLFDLCQKHIDELNEAGDELGSAALRYGFTEDEIKASFDG